LKLGARIHDGETDRGQMTKGIKNRNVMDGHIIIVDNNLHHRAISASSLGTILAILHYSFCKLKISGNHISHL